MPFVPKGKGHHHLWNPPPPAWSVRGGDEASEEEPPARKFPWMGGGRVGGHAGNEESEEKEETPSKFSKYSQVWLTIMYLSFCPRFVGARCTFECRRIESSNITDIWVICTSPGWYLSLWPLFKLERGARVNAAKKSFSNQQTFGLFVPRLAGLQIPLQWLVPKYGEVCMGMPVWLWVCLDRARPSAG
jgi:hypothetical protein